MFLPGTQETKTFHLHIPGGSFNFGYAVNACWANPGKTVTNPNTDFPPEANCLDPYKISISADDTLDEWTQSSTLVKVELFIHNMPGAEWHCYLDSPSINWLGGDFVSSEVLPDGNLIFIYSLTNGDGAKQGTYPLFVQAFNYNVLDPNFGEIRGWQVIPIIVHPIGEYPPQVQADAYPKLQSLGWDIDFFDNGSYSPQGADLVKYEWDFNNDGIYDAVGKEVKHSYNTEGDYYVQLRVTDSDGLTGVLPNPIKVHIKPGVGWARTFGSPFEDGAHAVATDSDGNIYVCGYTSGDMDLDPGRRTIISMDPDDGELF